MNSKGLINNAEIIHALKKDNPIRNKNPVEQAKQVCAELKAKKLGIINLIIYML